MSHTKKKVTE